MAMLAGPRRKQKVINLRAKNNAWSNDTTKFGQKMLEKMGWSQGKGLGAKENGIVDHVVARYKNDDRGLGYEDKNDQWTKHEDDFNSLLANLSNADSTDGKLHSGVSLEVKSKKSKARIHYHKFTRGKDIARYSAKDLANIFGKKSLDNEEEPEPQTLKENVKESEQIFTEKGSMEDYFKRKLSSINNKYSMPVNKESEADTDYAFQGFSGTNDNEENNVSSLTSLYSCNYTNQFTKACECETEITEDKVKKSKKRKKDKHIKQNDNHGTIIENCSSALKAQDDEHLEETKSKKKNKNRIEENPTSEIQEEVTVCKKKRSKHKPVDDLAAEDKVVSEISEENEPEIKKKKKKKKNQ